MHHFLRQEKGRLKKKFGVKNGERKAEKNGEIKKKKKEKKEQKSLVRRKISFTFAGRKNRNTDCNAGQKKRKKDRKTKVL